MSIDLAAVDAALISVQPILAVTAYPVLAITAGVAWWLRDQEPDGDIYSVADYFPRAVGRARVPGRRPVEAHAQTASVAAWSVDTPVYAAMTIRPMPEIVAQRVAHTWLAEIGQRAQHEVNA